MLPFGKSPSRSVSAADSCTIASFRRGREGSSSVHDGAEKPLGVHDETGKVGPVGAARPGLARPIGSPDLTRRCWRASAQSVLSAKHRLTLKASTSPATRSSVARALHREDRVRAVPPPRSPRSRGSARRAPRARLPFGSSAGFKEGCTYLCSSLISSSRQAYGRPADPRAKRSRHAAYGRRVPETERFEVVLTKAPLRERSPEMRLQAPDNRLRVVGPVAVPVTDNRIDQFGRNVVLA